MLLTGTVGVSARGAARAPRAPAWGRDDVIVRVRCLVVVPASSGPDRMSRRTLDDGGRRWQGPGRAGVGMETFRGCAAAHRHVLAHRGRARGRVRASKARPPRSASSVRQAGGLELAGGRGRTSRGPCCSWRPTRRCSRIHQLRRLARRPLAGARRLHGSHGSGEIAFAWTTRSRDETRDVRALDMLRDHLVSPLLHHLRGAARGGPCKRALRRTGAARLRRRHRAALPGGAFRRHVTPRAALVATLARCALR